MAVQLPSGLYSGFTEVLDSRPTMNIVNQNRLRKQAKEDALDEYDRKRLLNINSQGVRNIDRENFDKILSEIQLYNNQNKDKILKGNTPEAYEYEQKFRNFNSFVNQSKEATAKEDAVMKMYHEIFKAGGVIPEDDENDLNFMRDLYLHNRPIGDPERKDFDMAKYMSMTAKPFNQQYFLKGYGDIKRVAGSPRYENVEGNPLKQTEIIEEVFDEKGKEVIRNKSASDYHNNYSFNKQVKEALKTPTRVLQLSKTFEDAYGVPPETDEDYATAYTMELLQPKIAKTKVVDNTKGIIDYRFKNQQIRDAVMQKYRQANIILSAGVRGATGEVVTPPKDGENYDLTERLQGLKVSTLVNTPYGVAHDSKILYNPKTNEISYTDFNGNKKTKPFNQFKKDISTINTVQDLKIVDEVMNSIKSPQSVNKNKPQAGKYD